MEPFEEQLKQQGLSVIAGVDEVGRGCLAGPVVAAAVCLPPHYDLPGLNDSKKLSAKKRERLAEQIHQSGALICIGEASVQEISAINILQATFLAMIRAIEGLPQSPEHVLVDGSHRIPFKLEQTCIVQGDGRCASIAAASIVAKVHRDSFMTTLAETLPGYGFEKHKGYGTAYHRKQIAELGPTPIHRLTFKGVSEHLHKLRPWDGKSYLPIHSDS